MLPPPAPSATATATATATADHQGLFSFLDVERYETPSRDHEGSFSFFDVKRYSPIFPPPSLGIAESLNGPPKPIACRGLVKEVKGKGTGESRCLFWCQTLLTSMFVRSVTVIVPLQTR